MEATVRTAGTVPFALAGTRTSELLLSLVLVVRGAGLTTANLARMAGAFEGLLPAAMLPRRAAAREQSRRASRAAGPEAPGG